MILEGDILIIEVIISFILRRSDMLKNAIVFCPYFGKLPDYFQLWLNSCKSNSKINFIIFSDSDKKYMVPSNVEIVKLQFEEFVDIIQSKFDFQISLNTPYKLCDYKPAYGYLFSNYIANYDYWGCCDIDVIWGDIGKFMPDTDFDKINYNAHFSLYKNKEKINKAFMTRNNILSYKDIYTTDVHMAYDEDKRYGINSILESMGYKICDISENVADLRVETNNLQYPDKSTKGVIQKYNKSKKIIAYEYGRIYSYYIENNSLCKKEFAYVHMQKRKMQLKQLDDSNCFLICAHSIIPYQLPTIKIIETMQERSFYIDLLAIKYKALISKFNRMLFLIKLEGDREKK